MYSYGNHSYKMGMVYQGEFLTSKVSVSIMGVLLGGFGFVLVFFPQNGELA